VCRIPDKQSMLFEALCNVVQLQVTCIL